VSAMCASVHRASLIPNRWTVIPRIFNDPMRERYVFFCRASRCKDKPDNYQFEKINNILYSIQDYCQIILRISPDSFFVTIQLLPSEENPTTVTVTIFGKSENCKLKWIEDENEPIIIYG
ncbi:hypothetical protein PFISCL1PPCAC_4176, partial [Pristionchus fissidentatus]